MTLLAQDIIVTLIAVAAAVTVAWRLLGIVGPRQRDTACKTCASCPPGSAAAAASANPQPADSVPLPLLLPGGRRR